MRQYMSHLSIAKEAYRWELRSPVCVDAGSHSCFRSSKFDLSLPQWVRNLKRSISASILEHAPHWQEGFFDHLLRSEDSYSQKWEYVRQNPVRAGLTASYENWPYQGEIVRLPFD